MPRPCTGRVRVMKLVCPRKRKSDSMGKKRFSKKSRQLGKNLAKLMKKRMKMSSDMPKLESV